MGTFAVLALIAFLAVMSALAFGKDPYRSRHFVIDKDVRRYGAPDPVFHVRGKWPRNRVFYGSFSTLEAARAWCDEADKKFEGD